MEPTVLSGCTEKAKHESMQSSLMHNADDMTQPELNTGHHSECSTEVLFPKKRRLVFFRDRSGDLFYFLFTCFPLGIASYVDDMLC